ncbi:MAG: NifU family protein [Actinomycetes bacterium]
MSDGDTGEGTTPPRDLRSTGERIETLLASFAGSGLPNQERAEELVRLVAELYGAGLERLLEIVHDAGALSADVLDDLAADELVSSLLLVHNLHPYDVETRVHRALDSVRPYLGSHGGDVELLGVGADGVVRLRLVGSCGSCPSSSVTLKLAVEGAIETAAPEVTAIACEEAPAGPTVISVDSLLVRTRGEETAAVTAAWEPVDAAQMRSGEVRPVTVTGVDLVLCQVGATAYAYRDGCPACAASLAGASLQRTPGAAIGSAVLTCPGCGAHYDVHRAGASLDDPARHLDPLPLLERHGTLEVALPGAVAV